MRLDCGEFATAFSFDHFNPVQNRRHCVALGSSLKLRL
jgi:hypothetical protein